jgi:hypothetical protein
MTPVETLEWQILEWQLLEQAGGSVKKQVDYTTRQQILGQIERPIWWRSMRELQQHIEQQSQLAVEGKP